MMKSTKQFLKSYNIEYHYDSTGRLIITSYGTLLHLEKIEKNIFQNCTINNYLWLDNLLEIDKDFLRGSIIRGDLDLRRLIQIPEGFLSNTIIYKDLILSYVKYLPKGFCPNVKGRIFIGNLESKILSDLILYPGPKRELGFNLLR